MTFPLRLLGVLIGFAASLCAAQTGLPEVFVSHPTNNECSQPYFLENSLVFNYDGNEGGCCLWFAFRNCHEDWPGFVVNMSDGSDGTFSYFFSDTYPDCGDSPECGSMESMSPSWDVSNADAGYRYIVYHSAGAGCIAGSLTFTFTRAVLCPPPCDLCTPSFSPQPGERYLVSAWTHQNVDGAETNMTAPKIVVRYLDLSGTDIGASSSVLTEGPIIDGWQRMEQEIQILPSTAELRIEFQAIDEEVYYDDIRFFPVDGSLKSYVYDPVNLRFVAELDERHYTTFYEYDGEGKLARVKKETERGIMTIQETRYNSSKLSGDQ